MIRPRTLVPTPLRVAMALGLLAQLAFGQIPGLSCKPKRLDEPVIINRVTSDDICNIKGLNREFYSCSKSKNYSGAAYLHLSCAGISKSESSVILLGDCSSATDMSGSYVSLNNCNKFKCDVDSGLITILITRVSGKREQQSILEHFSREFRLKESTRKLKLSPVPIHVLYKKSRPIIDFQRESDSWISPFYNKYVTYYIGSGNSIPTLDYYLQTFEESVFSELLEIKTEQDLRKNEYSMASGADNMFIISWVISSILEIYWSRGIHRPPGTASDDFHGFDKELHSFDTGLSLRSHCSLSFSSFLFNIKSYLDDLIHSYDQHKSVTRPEDLHALGIKEVFISDMVDIDSFYLVYSPNEVNAVNSKLSETSFLNKPFPCMSRFKNAKKLKKTAFDHYSARNVDKKVSSLGMSQETVNEDVLVLVNMIHFMIHRYVIAVKEKNPFIIENNSAYRDNFEVYNVAYLSISELKKEVEDVCGSRAFKAYLKRKDTTAEEEYERSGIAINFIGSSSSSGTDSDDGVFKKRRAKRITYISGKSPTCSLKYSLEVVRKLDSIFFSMYSDYRQLKRNHITSPEYLMRSTYCVSKALFDTNYRDIPNESVVNAVMTNSIIYKYQTSTWTSIMVECQKELERKGNLSLFVDGKDVQDVCKAFSTCMFDGRSLNVGVDIFRQLTVVDHEGGFHEKSKLIRETCVAFSRILGLEDSEEESKPLNCHVFRLFQLALRIFQFQHGVTISKFKVSFVDKTGNTYFIPDTSTASYLLINDFCMDPEISSIIQCNFDWEAYRDVGSSKEGTGEVGEDGRHKRLTNFILLQDGSRISTPLYLKETTDDEFLRLSNGVLFARILAPEDSNLRLTYFSGLPFPYYGKHADMKRNTCGGQQPHRFAYTPEGSNAQKILVLKVKFESGPVSLITSEHFDNQFLIRSSKISRERFSVVDTPGLSVPLNPSIIQVEKKASWDSPCNPLLFPYVMIQEFVNPLGTGEDTGTEEKRGGGLVSSRPLNTMSDVVYPMDLHTVVDKIEEIDPLSLNFIMTGRGREHLMMFLKANYYIAYHTLTTMASFWTGGSRFRQHCDLHMSNVLTRFPSSWKDLKWGKFVAKVLESVDQGYFTIIDMDFSYESEMVIKNLPEDIERLPDKSPCKHHSVTYMNLMETRNDYVRVYDYLCSSQMSVESLTYFISETYSSRNVYSDLSSYYPDIMAIHNYTATYCMDTKNMMEEADDKDTADLALGFDAVQQLRRVVLSSMIQLDRLDSHSSGGDADLLSKVLLSNSVSASSNLGPRQSKQQTAAVVPSQAKKDYQIALGTSRSGSAVVIPLLAALQDLPSMQSNSPPDAIPYVSTKSSKHMMRQRMVPKVKASPVKEEKSVSWLSEVSKGKIIPMMVSPIQEQMISFYCIASSARMFLDVPSLRFMDLLGLLLQRSSLESYIRQIHFGPSLEDFEPTRYKLLSVESARQECMRSLENRSVIQELMPLLRDNPEVVCPKSVCRTIKYYDMFESMLSVYRFRLSHLIFMTFGLSDTFQRPEDQVLAFRAWVVERDDGRPSDKAVRRRPLTLSLGQVSSILELYQFCARDRFYSTLSYGQLKCKRLPDFEKHGQDSNGVVALKLSMVDGSSSTIWFSWVYNSVFSPFKSEFPFREIGSGISVIGLLMPSAATPVSAQTEPERERRLFIHKGGDKRMSELGSYEYRLSQSIYRKISEPHERLYRGSFHGYRLMEVDNMSVFALKEDSSISFYLWMKRIVNRVLAASPNLKEGRGEVVPFGSIPGHLQEEIIVLTGLVVKAFKSIWIPDPEYKQMCREKEPCFPMFCGMSSMNIILKVGSQRKVKDVKFLFGKDIRVVSTYIHEQRLYPVPESGKKKSSRLSGPVTVSHVLPNNCSGDSDEANDMVTVVSTLHYLTIVVQTGGQFDPLRLFSSGIADTYHRYSKMTIEEITGHINKFCEQLQKHSGSKNQIC